MPNYIIKAIREGRAERGGGRKEGEEKKEEGGEEEKKQKRRDVKEEELKKRRKEEKNTKMTYVSPSLHCFLQVGLGYSFEGQGLVLFGRWWSHEGKG